MVDSRTDARDAARAAVVLRDLMRPQQLAGVGPNCVQVAGPIGKVHGITRDGWCRGHIAAGGEHPFRDETTDVDGIDLFFGPLTSRVIQVPAGDTPATQPGPFPVPVSVLVLVLRLGAAAGAYRHHRDRRKRQAGSSPLSRLHTSLLLLTHRAPDCNMRCFGH